MSTDKKLYAERDIRAQEDYYTAHVMAMTAEDLYEKSDIAAELAHRDIEIDKLKEALYFYANPETYFAVMLLPDPPAGAIMEDFSDTPMLSHKPGKLARQVLGMEDE